MYKESLSQILYEDVLEVCHRVFHKHHVCVNGLLYHQKLGRQCSGFRPLDARSSLAGKRTLLSEVITFDSAPVLIPSTAAEAETEPSVVNSRSNKHCTPLQKSGWLGPIFWPTLFCPFPAGSIRLSSGGGLYPSSSTGRLTLAAMRVRRRSRAYARFLCCDRSSEA